MAAGAQSTVIEALGGAHMNKERKCLTIVRLNARVQKYNLTAANYGLNCSKYYVIRYNMYMHQQQYVNSYRYSRVSWVQALAILNVPYWSCKLF